MADDYDFQINDLKFREATSDKMPYSRSTAPFRKDQFDSAPTVGDQSLTGWWTRGQLSFHKGAGLKFYEVLEGETVLNRFDSSEKVDVFTPGEARPNRYLSYLPTTPTGSNITGMFGGNGGVWVRDLSSNLRLIDTYGSITNYSAPSPETGYWTAACASPTHLFLRTAPNDKIDKFSLETKASVGPIYDHDKFIDNLWYAKGRLWVLDRDGKVFAVSVSPTGTLPVALGTEAFRFPQARADSGDRASLTEVGPGVLLSYYDENIYFIGVEKTGSVPTLSAPVVVATMPRGEQVTNLRHHLGLVVICTNKGVRVGQVNGDGSVVYGPLFIDELEDCGNIRQISAAGQSVGIAGSRRAPDGVSIRAAAYEIDLSQSVADNPLVFPWRRVADWRVDGYPTWYGATEVAGNHAWWFNDEILYQDVWAEQAGWIRSGFHRFGTLDPKVFSKVTVRASGKGTIQVSQIDANENITALGVMDCEDGVGEFAFTLPDPVERVALKFTLTGVVDPLRGFVLARTAPRLLGYQIKALPAPTRQRLLRWPLLIQDNIRLRRGNAVGKEGRAYSDIKALEALESSAAVVTFTDHRTGETGSAYIDSVEYQGVTASSPTSNGFGGLAYVTLRVIS